MKFVADVVTQRVVNVLESIQIQKHHRNLRVIAMSVRNRLAESILQQHTVRKISEDIVLRQMLHLPYYLAGHAYVMKNNHASGYPTGPVVDWGGRIFNRRFKPVPSNENTVRC